jgi:osmotically inducible lipoprotein OsmB
MKTQNLIVSRSLAVIATTTLALGLGACGNMSRQDQNTAVGAGVGAVGGAVLTGGSTLGTVGGAAVGGLIGNQVGTKK